MTARTMSGSVASRTSKRNIKPELSISSKTVSRRTDVATGKTIGNSTESAKDAGYAERPFAVSLSDHERHFARLFCWIV